MERHLGTYPLAGRQQQTLISSQVHWHGIRQFESFQHDGVNGITECPIAPGDTFTYRFRALQYGTGQFGWGPKPSKYTLWLDQGKAHMLILVNTAVDTTFVFSIDDHLLEVIEMDFVPIKPYNTTNLKIGIGKDPLRVGWGVLLDTAC
jgi:FtsP/CotA-like multicopper oxidase with cupredoxin domain